MIWGGKNADLGRSNYSLLNCLIFCTLTDDALMVFALSDCTFDGSARRAVNRQNVCKNDYALKSFDNSRWYALTRT